MRGVCLPMRARLFASFSSGASTETMGPLPFGFALRLWVGAKPPAPGVRAAVGFELVAVFPSTVVEGEDTPRGVELATGD